MEYQTILEGWQKKKRLWLLKLDNYVILNHQDKISLEANQVFNEMEQYLENSCKIAYEKGKQDLIKQLDTAGKGL